jgi:hypothetical protein
MVNTADHLRCVSWLTVFIVLDTDYSYKQITFWCFEAWQKWGEFYTVLDSCSITACTALCHAFNNCCYSAGMP